MPLVQILVPRGRTWHAPRFNVHLGNCRVHLLFCKDNKIAGIFLSGTNLDSYWKHLRYLVGCGPGMTYLHDPNKIFRRKSVSLRSFGLPVVSIIHLLFRKVNIAIQYSSPMLLFPGADKLLLGSTMKDVEMLDSAFGQCICSQFKAFSRSSRGNWR
jgi:hypothetical protein